MTQVLLKKKQRWWGTNVTLINGPLPTRKATFNLFFPLSVKEFRLQLMHSSKVKKGLIGFDLVILVPLLGLCREASKEGIALTIVLRGTYFLTRHTWWFIKRLNNRVKYRSALNRFYI